MKLFITYLYIYNYIEKIYILIVQPATIDRWYNYIYSTAA